MATPHVYARKNILKLTVGEKDSLVRAFKAIQDEDPDSDSSFFKLAGYHGLPGGFCHHGDVLFPTWHRAYLHKFEQALQSKVPGVTIPYWDQVKAVENDSVVPPLLTRRTYTFTDGTTIENPLFSYRLQRAIKDLSENELCSKPQGYPTVRFPFSGLVSQKYGAQTADHNETLHGNGTLFTNQLLNGNIERWLLRSSYVTSNGATIPAGVRDTYLKCLEAPNYTVFSNTTSAGEWNGQHPTEVQYPIESPHNSMHLAVGGIQVPKQDASSYPFANGDMGENETAAFDPIFFFHHCYIDFMFWKWQQRNGSTETLTFEPEEYPGVGDFTPESELEPFKTSDGTRYLNSKDVVNIEKLGYRYSEPKPSPYLGELPSIPESPRLKISKLNRGEIYGSFVVSVWFEDSDRELQLIGCEPILSRWNVKACEGCTDKLNIELVVPLIGWSKDDARQAAADKKFVVKTHLRELPGSGPPRNGPGSLNPEWELDPGSVA